MVRGGGGGGGGSSLRVRGEVGESNITTCDHKNNLKCHVHTLYLHTTCTFGSHFSIALHDTSLFEVVNSDNAIFSPQLENSWYLAI